MRYRRRRTIEILGLRQELETKSHSPPRARRSWGPRGLEGGYSVRVFFMIKCLVSQSESIKDEGVRLRVMSCGDV